MTTDALAHHQKTGFSVRRTPAYRRTRSLGIGDWEFWEFWSFESFGSFGVLGILGGVFFSIFFSTTTASIAGGSEGVFCDIFPVMNICV